MPLNQKQLEEYLFKATDIIRGKFDGSEFKYFIFGLFFLKRCSDVFEEQRLAIITEKVEEGHSQVQAEELAEQKTNYEDIVYVPVTARWVNLLKECLENSQLGALLNKSFNDLELHNENLESVLSSIDFNREIGRRPGPNAKIRELIVYFNGVSLADNNLASPGIIGKTLQSLISKFADIAGKKGGEFSTPQELNHLMVRLVKPQPFQSVYDPCCGAAGTLLAAQEFVLSTSSETIDCFGQELTSNTWSIAKMNMMLNGIKNSDIRNSDTLINPCHMNSEGELIKFDRIICQPPFSTNFDHGGTGNNAVTVEFPERYKYGHVSPKGKKGDLMFIQHMLAVCSDKGKVATTIPLGGLWRGGEEHSIRKGIVEDDVLEAVISLPPSLFYGTGIQAALLVFNKNKKIERKNKTIFIDASHDYSKRKNSNQLRSEDLSRVIQAYDAFKGIGSYSKIVNLDEIREKNYDLTVKIYVDNSPVLKRINELNKYHQSFEEYGFSQEHHNCIVRSISTPRGGSKANSIIIRKIILGKKDYFEHEEIGIKQRSNYYEIVFDENIVSSTYVELFFESELGRLTLLNLPSGDYNRKITKQDIENITIYLPSEEEQEKIVNLARKLEDAKDLLSTYKKDLLTKPALYQDVAKQTDDFVYELSTLDEVSRVKQLIKINETQRIEFKQTFFVNADDLGGTFNKGDKDHKKKCKAEQYKIAKNIATFLNTDGGTLLIGVTDDSQVSGVELEMQHIKEVKAEAYIKRLSQDVANLLGERNNKWIEYSSVEINHKTIIVVDCKQAAKPVLIPTKTKEGAILSDPTDFIIRRGTASVTLNGYELLEYIDSHFKK